MMMFMWIELKFKRYEIFCENHAVDTRYQFEFGSVMEKKRYNDF